MKTGKRDAYAAAAARVEMGELETIPLDLVADPNLPARETMDQARMDDLKESLATVGLLSPIVVKRRGAGFEVVAGHRRTLAARALHWQTIRALVYPEDWVDADAAMLHENIMRENLNAAQEAVFFAQLCEKYKLDEEGLCKLVKRKPDYIADRLQMLRQDPEVFQAVRDGRISFAVGRILNRFPDESIRRYHLDQAIRSGTNSHVVQQWWEEWKSYHLPDARRVNADTPLPASVHAEPSPGIECFLCGGNKDPYNLVTVLVHKWELSEIRRMLAASEAEVVQLAKGVTSSAETADKPNGGVK